MASAPAAEHVLAILSLMSTQSEPMAASGIAASLGLPRSTTYRLLAVLVDRGFVSYVAGQRRYCLGVASFELGSAYTRQAPLQRIARPVIAHLVEQTRQNAHLAVLHGRDVLYVLEERAPGGPALLTDVDVRLPATLTASGLAMLGQLPAPQVRALFPDASSFADALPGAAPGPRTLLELRRMLVDVRARGHAVERGTVRAGLASVAAAVLDSNHYPVAAVAVTYVDGALAADRLAVVADLMQRAAAQVARRIGWVP